VLRTAFALLADLLGLVALVFRSRAELAAENLFLRKQLACYLERQVRPHRTDNASRIALVALFRLIEWRGLLTIVRPEILVRWHRDLHRLFWGVKSGRHGRPRMPARLQQLIADMAAANRTWGEERIAAELRLKLGLTVSARTVRRYMPRRLPLDRARSLGRRFFGTPAPYWRATSLWS
jgi:putative transposase